MGLAAKRSTKPPIVFCAKKTTRFAISSCLTTGGVTAGPKPKPPPEYPRPYNLPPRSERNPCIGGSPHRSEVGVEPEPCKASACRTREGAESRSRTQRKRGQTAGQ